MHQDTVYWVDIQLVQRTGLKFYQTRSNAIILNDTLPAHCISKAILMKSEEIKNQKKIIGCAIWILILLEAAKTSNESNQNPENDVLFGREGTKHSTRTERPVDGPKSIQSCVSMPVELVDKYEDKDENVDADQTRMVRPASGQQFTQLEEMDIDFRVFGLPHAVVKQAEHLQVQEFVKKIESHPHRKALQADLQQNNVYNPFGNNSKAMIREMGNVELFELCVTIPTVQCSQCLLYWNQGVTTALADTSWFERESRRKFNKLRLDALSIPHYVIEKGRLHGARHGKTEEQKEHSVAFSAWKRCRKRVDAHGDLKTMNGNVMLALILFLYLQEDSQQDVGQSSDLDQKRSDRLLLLTDHRENGTESLN